MRTDIAKANPTCQRKSASLAPARFHGGANGKIAGTTFVIALIGVGAIEKP